MINSDSDSERIARPPNAAAGADFTGRAGQASIDPSAFRSSTSEDEHKFRLNANRSMLRGKTAVEVLSGYQMELVVDRSMSMNAHDCPDGLSRWNWCGEQSIELATALTPFTKNGLTIATFATKYDIFEHATAQNITDIFNGVHLRLGTRLFEPLAERIDNYFAHYRPGDRPLLIVVVTDGVPVPRFEPILVRNELVKTSHRMAYRDQVSVLFCQVGGGDMRGKRYLYDLSENLINYGAKYQFVHTIYFDSLVANGLGQSLAQSIMAHAPVTQSGEQSRRNSPVDVSDFQLRPGNQQTRQTQWTGPNLSQSQITGEFEPFDFYTNNPPVDTFGVRHFLNGEHFDLSRQPLLPVLTTVNQPTETDLRRAQRRQTFSPRRGRGRWP